MTDARTGSRRRPIGLLLGAASVAVALAAVGAAAEQARDAYLEGYVTAVIERDLGVTVESVEVRGAVARVVLADPGGETTERVAESVAHLEDIDRVEVRVAGEDDVAPVRIGFDDPVDEEEGSTVDVLPRHELFEPLMADPRQPHFSAIYQWYLDDPELVHVGSANFGETFALLGGEVGDGRWEIGLLGGVFSVFDLDAESFDLVNSDFWVGPTLSLRRGSLSGQVRLYHQSSHLGDEFLLRNRVDRVNLSYEGVDVLASAQVHPALRLYAGGGAIVNSEPDLDPWSVQAGAELRSPMTFLGGTTRPVAAFDFQVREENRWREELGAAAGLEFANATAPGLRLQFLLTWFRGNSPNGQFFDRRIESLGLGAHLHF